MMQIVQDIWYYASFAILACIIVLELGCYFMVYVVFRVLQADDFYERFDHRSSAAIRTSFIGCMLFILAVHFFNRTMFSILF